MRSGKSRDSEKETGNADRTSGDGTVSRIGVTAVNARLSDKECFTESCTEDDVD
jgi:hypothetical protein